jgi:hypothetical protein
MGNMIDFDVDNRRRTARTRGNAEISSTLQIENNIAAYEAKRLGSDPWIFQGL